jgi:branched-chain amino acid transport system permease protein
MIQSRTAPAGLRNLPLTASLREFVVPLVVVAVVVLGVPAVFTQYWVQVLTSMAIYSIVALSLALLLGRVGLVSLGQIALLALGGWVALRLHFAFGLPFEVLMLATGLIVGLIGTLIGLPALRLSGLYLALITLMAAAGFTQVLQATNFPNGGPGFLGYSSSIMGTTTATASLPRPDYLASDSAFYRGVAIVTALMFAVGIVHVRSRAGRAWAAIRQSEAAAIAAGVNVTLYKLWAFALASFMTGVAGCLLAASAGGLTTYGFPAQDSITLLAVVLMGGIFTFWGPLVAAGLLKLLPELLKNWGVPADLLLILFGLGVLQAMLTAPAGLAIQVPKDLANLGRALGGLASRGQAR